MGIGDGKGPGPLLRRLQSSGARPRAAALGSNERPNQRPRTARVARLIARFQPLPRVRGDGLRRRLWLSVGVGARPIARRLSIGVSGHPASRSAGISSRLLLPGCFGFFF